MTVSLHSLLTGGAAPGVFVWSGAPDRDLGTEARSAGWDVLRLDTTSARGADDLYDAVTRDWSLPEWFGRNLDALWDALGERADTATILIWEGAESLADHDPDLAVVVLGLLRDATVQAARLAVIVRPADESSGRRPLLSELDGLL